MHVALLYYMDRYIGMVGVTEMIYLLDTVLN